MRIDHQPSQQSSSISSLLLITAEGDTTLQHFKAVLLFWKKQSMLVKEQRTLKRDRDMSRK